MAAKRSRIEVDPDYQDVTEQQNKRQRVLEQDAKVATRLKIENIIKKEFAAEVHSREMEIDLIDQRLNQTRLIMDRLRACIVANYYGSAGQTKLWQGKMSDPEQVPSIHPAVKQHLGKTPKGYPSLTAEIKTETPAETLSSDTVNTDSTLLSSTHVTKEEPGDVKDVSMEVSDTAPASCRSIRAKVKKRIIVGNVSKYIPVDRREENDQPTHKWMVYVRGPKDHPHIDHFVKKVWFLLHPSYRPNDLVEVSNPPFHLTRRGWGEFPVRVQLHFKDSRNKRLDIIHQLKLDRTYTGLQTLGAETVVDVELERDLIPERTKQYKNGNKKESSKQVASSTVNGETGEHSGAKQEELDLNFTIKEHMTPKKASTTDQKLLIEDVTSFQSKPQGNTDNGTAITLLSNKENCFIKSGNGSLGSPSPQKPRSSLGGPSQMKVVNNTKGLSIVNPTSTLSSSLVVGNLLVNSLDGKTPSGTMSPQAGLGVVTQQASPSRPGSTLLLSGTSGVQVVLGGFGSISGVQKPIETKQPTQKGKSLLKKTSAGKSATTTGQTSSISSQAVVQTGTVNRLGGAQSPSSFVLQGLGSLSGAGSVCVTDSAKPSSKTVTQGVPGIPTNMIVTGGSTSGSKTPSFHIVTSNQTEGTRPQKQVSTPTGKVAGAPANEPVPANPVNLPAPAQTLYVRCKDNSGNIFLVPHHLLKQVSTTVTKTTTHNTSSTVTISSSTTSSLVGATTTGETRVTSHQQKSLLPHTSLDQKTSLPALSSKGHSLPSSLLIKVEPQLPTQVMQQNSAGQSELQKSLLSGGSQRPQSAVCTVDLKKPSTVFHVKAGTEDPTQMSSKVVKDLFSDQKIDHKYSTPNVSPEKRDGALSSLTTVSSTKSQSNLLNSESNTETGKDKLPDISTSKVQPQGQRGQGPLSTSGHLKVTPQGLKMVGKGRVDSSQGKTPPNTPQKMATFKLQGQGTALTSDQGPQSLSSTPNLPGTLPQTSVLPSNGMGNIKERTTESNVVESQIKKVETQSLLTGKTMISFNNTSKSSTSKVKTMLPNSDQKPFVTLLNGQSLGSCLGGKTSLLSGETSKIVSTVTSCQTTCSTLRPLMTFTSSRDQDAKTIVNSGTGKTTDLIQNSQCKTMMATIGSQKLLIHVPELNPVTDEDHPPNLTDTSPWLHEKVNNKYVISDESSSQQKKIINAKKKKCYETVPFKPATVPPISVSSFHDLLSLVKAAVKRHPVICENVDRSLHPYCARSLEEWLSWNVGKRRASEWQRASFVRKYLLKNLSGETTFKGESLWTTKQIMVWCRHHVYSPHFLEKTLHPSPVELGADSSMLGKRYTSATDSDVILSRIHDINAARSADDTDEMDVDIISVEPPKVKIKTEVNKEMVYCDPVILPQSHQARFVQDLSTKIGVRFEPTVIDQEVHGSVTEDMIYSAMKTFMSDILRETYSMKVNLGRYADGIGVGDVYRTISRMEETDFLTNHYLGVPANTPVSSDR